MLLLKSEILKKIIKIFLKSLNIDLKMKLCSPKSHVLAFLMWIHTRNPQASIPLIINIEDIERSDIERGK